MIKIHQKKFHQEEIKVFLKFINHIFLFIYFLHILYIVIYPQTKISIKKL
jgi:hypothetical protein